MIRYFNEEPWHHLSQSYELLNNKSFVINILKIQIIYMGQNYQDGKYALFMSLFVSCIRWATMHCIFLKTLWNSQVKGCEYYSSYVPMFLGHLYRASGPEQGYFHPPGLEDSQRLNPGTCKLSQLSRPAPSQSSCFFSPSPAGRGRGRQTCKMSKSLHRQNF